MDWFKVGILCFGSCYALALVLELTRVRATRWRWMAVVTVMIGFATQTIYLGVKGVVVKGLPLTNFTLSLIAVSWIFVIAYLHLALNFRQASPRVFLLSFVVALTALAGMTRADTFRPWEELGELSSFSPVWGAVHGIFWLLGTVAVSVGFLAGFMYLVQSWQLKHKTLSSTHFPLPSLEQLERWNRHAITTAFPLLTVGLGLGVWLLVQSRSQGTMVLPWTDPKLLFTLLTWTVLAVLLHARFSPRRRGRRVATLTIIAFALLIFTIAGVDPLFGSLHDTLGVAP